MENSLNSLAFTRLTQFKLRTISACVLTLAFFASPSYAGYDEGLKASAKGDYATAMNEWRPLAESGHADAQARLGDLYVAGHGVNRDPIQAAIWYRKAAEQGNVHAQTKFAFLNFVGNEVPKDLAQAAKWLQLAAGHGDSEAQGLLGLAHRFGIGVPKDEAQAEKWLQLAADQGDVDGLFFLGDFYASGSGPRRDIDQAISLFIRSANKGNVLAQDRLGRMYSKGEGVKQDYVEAAGWYKKAVAQGHKKSMAKLAIIYMGEGGVAKNIKEGKDLIRKLVEMGDAVGELLIGSFYADGTWVGDGKRDYVHAAEWWQRCAEKGNGGCQSRLGFLYMKGFGVIQDLNRAEDWLTKAVRAGDRSASEYLYQLGYLKLEEYDKRRELEQPLDGLEYSGSARSGQENCRNVTVTGSGIGIGTETMSAPQMGDSVVTRCD
ncbi:MAG TPA: SEL1-like repeat protein [Noviherbaspirillum sp.]|nr:SEL1-like repeat protein [Noviherbaspirillum sp.]